MPTKKVVIKTTLAEVAAPPPVKEEEVSAMVTRNPLTHAYVVHVSAAHPDVMEVVVNGRHVWSGVA